MNEVKKRDDKGVRIMGAYSKKYSKNDVAEVGEMNDLDALLTVSIEQLGKRKCGRIASFPDNADGLSAFLLATQQYFEYIADANRINEEKLIPDVEGWCIFIGLSKQTVLNYAKRSQTWNDSIEYVKECILASKKQLAFRFKIPPVVYLNDVSNNHNYFNTNEFKLVSASVEGAKKPERTASQIAERYADYVGMKEPTKPEL